jgi:phage portal protein BeeE
MRTRPLQTGSSNRVMRQMRRNEMQRAVPTRREVSFQQLYDAPNAEMPLSDFPALARNAYGAGGGSGGNSVIFSLIDKRMSVFSEAAFKFRNLSDKRLFGDPALASLETPWPDGSAGDLWNRFEQDASLAGNAYIRDAGDQLERLRPDCVTIISTLVPDAVGGQVRKVLGVWYDPSIYDQEREPDFYPISEVAHWAPVPDPLANFRGMSWLTPVIREINGDVRMSEYREAFFKNAATPNIVIRYEQKMAPERIERLATSIKARHTGPDGAFGTLVLDEGADLTVVGADMAQASYDALQAAGETRICMASGVPAIVAGAREGLQASQIGEYQQALRAFADLKMRPNWRSACAALQKLVVVPAGAQLWFDTSDVSALRQGEKDSADTMVQLAAAYNQFFMAGCEPNSITRALAAGDVTLLIHTGLTSVQAQGKPPTPAAPEPPVSAQINGKTPAPAAA